MTDNNTQLAPIAPQPPPQPQPASAAVIEYDHAAALPIVGISDLYTAGDLIAKSGILGAKSPAEGFLVAAICHQERISFLKFGELYYLLDGKISIKAEALLARLLELGGTYKVLERTPDKVSLVLKYKAAEYTSELTWTEAQQESYTRQKDGKTLKTNWSTPRRRMQMMWARAISDGVRVVCPLATRGTYTPEEVMDFDDGGDTDSAPRQPRTVRMAAAGDVMPPIVPLVAEQAPVMQAPTPAAAAPEPLPSPFDDAPPAAELPPVDYSICRCPGAMQGRRWDSMDNRSLELAAATYHPDITDGDKAVMSQILAERQQQQQAPPQQ